MKVDALRKGLYLGAIEADQNKGRKKDGEEKKKKKKHVR